MPNNKTSSTPIQPPPSPYPSTSKLPKFLRAPASRDRSKSVAETSTTSLASTSSDGSTAKARKSRFLSRRSADAPSPAPTPGEQYAEHEETPVIVEPVTIPRPHRPTGSGASSPTSPVSPTSSPPPNRPHLTSLYASTPSSSSSSSRIGDLPTRLSGWFSHTFSTSSTDLSLPSLLSHSASGSGMGGAGSPKRATGAAALLAAAKHGKGHLDKAMRYLLDSDATPDRCEDPIWILGVRHGGWEPPLPTIPSVVPSNSNSNSLSSSSRSLRSSVSSASDMTVHQGPGGKGGPGGQAIQWPPEFYADFTSRVWLTYRAQFEPIRDGRLADLTGESAEFLGGTPGKRGSREGEGGAGGGRKWWGAEKGWTSDSGWGCMLRTGQSLLANALIHLHLGRDWRRPPHAVHTADYATYVKILTWFLDTPNKDAPFSVHRMALAGKELGTEVGNWFGPSTAAGGIRTLVTAFPDAGLGVAVATDGVLFQSEVFTSSHTVASSARSPRRHNKALSASWGDRPVLLLIGVRLGLDGVNPIYYETIKMLYTFPQSVGIAGGRPSSSYYFVGSQADNLFYLDPHHARPAIPLRTPPTTSIHRETTPEDSADRLPNRAATRSPSSVRTGSSTFSYHAPLSPSPLQQEFSTSSESATSSDSGARHHTKAHSTTAASRSPSIRHSQNQHPNSNSRFRSASVSHSHSNSPASSEVMSESELRMASGLDPLQDFYVSAYPAAELRTFHCERVRKMPLSGLDPSMLIGFLCKDEADWEDFRRRVGELPRTVFSVQEEPPTWPVDFDDNMGLESISEPDPDDLLMEMEMDDEDEGDDDDDDGDGEQFFETRSASASTSSTSASGSGSGSSARRGKGRALSEEVDTEEDPVDPITPLPNARFSIPRSAGSGKDADDGEDDGERVERDMYEEGDIEDDWVDPSVPTPIPSDPPAILVSSASVVHAKTPKKARKGRGRNEVPVPVPLVKIPMPMPSSNQDQEHFPFPMTQREKEVSPSRPEHRVRHTSIKNTGKRMHMARARDGGRTQSGGVKGILPDD
ncbi:hypothetical protein DXG01_001444 [Tephrocybe rancida]|nr:hypothetical protein DXG01_001444 [Tephrocybe rancida]